MKTFGAKQYCAVVKINQQYQRAVQTRAASYLDMNKEDKKAKKASERSLNPLIDKAS